MDWGAASFFARIAAWLMPRDRKPAPGAKLAIRLHDAEVRDLHFKATNEGWEPTTLRNSVRMRGWVPRISGQNIFGWKRLRVGEYLIVGADLRLDSLQSREFSAMPIDERMTHPMIGFRVYTFGHLRGRRIKIRTITSHADQVGFWRFYWRLARALLRNDFPPQSERFGRIS